MSALQESHLCLLQAEGGALAFIQGSQENITQGKTSRGLLAFVNGDHEYVLFDPYSDEATEHGVVHRKGLVSEETGTKLILQ